MVDQLIYSKIFPFYRCAFLFFLLVGVAGYLNLEILVTRDTAYTLELDRWRERDYLGHR
jgi:hypothetical protein